MEALADLSTFSKDFTTDGAADDGAIVVRWRGTADLRSREALGEVLRRLHDEMRRRRAPEARVDLTGLEFMNSSCFTSVLRWINQVLELAPGDRYRIRFRGNPSLQWQKRSLRALQTFAVDLVSVDT
jgi:hypothetical protein